MADDDVPRRDQRLLGQGTTRRCALFLVLVVTLAVGLSLRAVRVLVSSGQDPDLLHTLDGRHRGLPSLDTLRMAKWELARSYEAGILDDVEPIAVTAGGLMLLTAAVLHLGGPAWRKRRLHRITPGDVIPHDALLRLTRHAGISRIPAFYCDPRRLSTGAVTFGSAGRYCLALDNGLVALAGDAPLAFDDTVSLPGAADGPGSLPEGPNEADSQRSWSKDGQCNLKPLPCPAPDGTTRDPVPGSGRSTRTDFDSWLQDTGEGAIFAAVVLHELAHLRNRDVELGSAVRALWLALVATVVLPYMALLAWLYGSELSGAARYSWSGRQWSPLWEAAVVAVLVAMVYMAYTDILRHRELCADLDAVDWGADPQAWNVVAKEQTGRRMGPKWDLEHWHTEPDDGWISLFTWVRKARPLRGGTRPWHTHPGWWWRIRALKRPAHPVGPNGTWTQAVILAGTAVVLLHTLLNELAHAAGLAPLTSALFYSGAVLCVSLGRPLTVHPSHRFRPQQRAFGVQSRGRIRRAALLGGCVLLLVVIDPMGPLFVAG
ncbi:M48 family metalloprotease [Streptomyces sp. NRRL B-1347]|uniref:M48 family metalloprotease n=1 Tax=Streptomyces sp. NRRL B-1347 TaxID=1476877 RepID=UPI0004C7FFB9|nr:M48 family metalloprotease [Streptomyces sp. NRRL B-1347]